MRLVLLFLTSLLLLSTGHAETYSFGVVPQYETQRLHAIWKPILKQLSETTGHDFQLRTPGSIPLFEKAFLRGEYDIAYMNPWHSVMAHEAQGYTPIIRDGDRQLIGILTVEKDSEINSIEQLHGKTLAFPAPNALGASLLMRAELKKIHGIDINPIYVKTHSSVYLNVALGKTAGGGGVWRTLRDQPPLLQSRLKVIYETRAMNPHPIVTHPRIGAAAKAAIQATFIELAATAAGEKLLQQVPINRASDSDISEYLLLRDWGLRDFYVE